MTQSGHRHKQFPLLGVKRTSGEGASMSAYYSKRTPGSRRSISAFGGKGPRAVYLAGGLIGSGGRGVTSATLTVVSGRSMSVTTTRTPFTVTSKNA